MKVFMIGGTGLLGSVSAKELIKRGHSVVTVSLPPILPEMNLPKEMEVHLGNILEMSDEEIMKLMQGCDAFLFAAGVDERVEFPAPVYNAYKQYNIDPINRLLPLAKSVGIKKCVVMGSYFSYFAKIRPDLELTKHHPYIRSRIDQEKAAFSYNDEHMEVMVLELPYIFGVQKGRKPVWMMYITLLNNMKKNIYFPKGGTTMVTLRQVAESVAGAFERGVGNTAYPVGWYNKTWKELLTIVKDAMGTPEKKIVTIPTFMYTLISVFLKRSYKKKNIEPGLEPVKFVKLMTTNSFIDKDMIQNELGVTEDDIDANIKESITYCVEIVKHNKEVVDMKTK